MNDETRTERSLGGRDVKLKIWVPESVYAAMTLLADDLDISRAEWTRDALITHAFGRPRLEKAKREESCWYVSQIRFSRRAPEPGETPLPLGKSTIDSVVLVANALHAALKVLAQQAGIPIGTYASYVLCWTAFGYGFHVHSAAPLTAGYLIGDAGDTPADSGEPQ